MFLLFKVLSISFITEAFTEEQKDSIAYSDHEDEDGNTVYDERMVGIIPESSSPSLEYDDKKKKYSPCFRKEMTQKEIVTYIINTNKTLYNDYQIYQGLINAINDRDKKTYLNIVHNNKNNKYISKKMKKALKTYINLEEYIINSFDYEYSKE